MSRQVVSFSLNSSTVKLLESEGSKYPGSKSAWVEAILKSSLRFISEKGFDEFRNILREEIK